MLPLPCMLVCIFVCANRTRDRGCSKHPVFPAPSLLEEGKPRCKPRAQCVARSRKCITSLKLDQKSLSSSLRKQGPITTGRNWFMRSLLSCHFQQQRPRRMGPCFRRDDSNSERQRDRILHLARRTARLHT